MDAGGMGSNPDTTKVYNPLGYPYHVHSLIGQNVFDELKFQWNRSRTQLFAKVSFRLFHPAKSLNAAAAAAAAAEASV